jgi:hypothetical protein
MLLWAFIHHIPNGICITGEIKINLSKSGTKQTQNPNDQIDAKLLLKKQIKVRGSPAFH